MVEYEGVPHAVVAVEKNDPVIRIEADQRKRLRGHAALSTERVNRYHASTAQLEAVRLEGLQMVNAMSDFEADRYSPGATVGGFVEFSAKITATADLTDCYVAVVAFETAFLQSDSHPPKAQIRVRQLPDLKAGQTMPVKFSASPFLGREPMSGFVLLFSAGREVRTNFSAQGAPYFYRRERLIHTATVKRWLEENKLMSRPIQPVLQIPPIFLPTEGIPSDAIADLTVAADGTVQQVSLNRTFPGEVAEKIQRTLSSWLFLPRINEGVPVLSHVQVPLRF